MENEKNSGKNNKIYWGIDIGTNSIGWAATDEAYNLLKYKGNKTWGSVAFDNANSSSERRAFRAARRRLDRKQQRTELLNDLFAKEITKKDPTFFIRLKESALWYDDKSTDSKYTFFNDAEYTDSQFYAEYKTIHHLIVELMQNKAAHDVRLVYLACKYLLTHRGHFLSPINENNIDQLFDFMPVYDDFMQWFDGNEPWECDPKEFKEHLYKVISKKENKESLKQLVGISKSHSADEEEYCTVNTGKLINFLCGAKTRLSDIFYMPEYKELRKDDISLASAEDLDNFDIILNDLEPSHAELIRRCKNIYDSIILIYVLGGDEKITVSEAKVKVYECHKQDLKLLKYMVKKYLPEKNAEVFRKSGIHNYAEYAKNFSSSKERPTIENPDQEMFCKYLKNIFENVVPNEEDRKAFEEMMDKINANTLCPKQVNINNRTIPYQLYYNELKTILDNASSYLPFLNECDEYGSVKDKILSIMKFRIPYYVGPLNANSDAAWIKRKAEGKILPWNFDEKVDKDGSEEVFIKRMTCKCSYLAGCYVLPKNSLLYSKFCVLNEINNIKINDQAISVECKQSIYNELFMKYKSVTVKRLTDFLTANGYMQKGDILSGIDKEKTAASSLSSFISFKPLIESGKLTENDAERIIERLCCTDDKNRLRNWLKTNYELLSKEDITYISGLNMKGFGRLSGQLLTEVFPVDPESGEVYDRNIITAMWETNDNLMKLLSNNYTYKNVIEEENRAYYDVNPTSMVEYLNSVNVSSSVRRAIYRAIDIVKDIRKCTGKNPDKIFIEMARDLENKNEKGKRTKSRKDKLIELYKRAKEDTSELYKQLQNTDEQKLKSDKLFLYYLQFGRCMYSGEAIKDLSEISSKKYDIDHIYPQSLVKDDSLDNRVLVLSELNGEKQDRPIKKSIINKMKSTWEHWHKIGCISDKKYTRLLRSAPFTDEELAGFINRQLVETRQSAKALAHILAQLYPNAEIVYVKAGLVSEFRNLKKVIKCREINDLHHAKDAYLNIVLGNIYNVKFTKNPINFIKNSNREPYSMKLKALLFCDDECGRCRRIERNGVIAWNDDGSTLKTVMNTVNKSSIIYNVYSYMRKGGFFNQKPLKAEQNNALYCRKKNLPVERYGGHNKITIAAFIPVKYYTDRGRSGVALLPLTLLAMKQFLEDEKFASEYIRNKTEETVKLKKTEKAFDRIELPLGKRFTKINTVLELDGFRVIITGKTNNRLMISSVMPLILAHDEEEYVIKIFSYLQKSDNGRKYKIDPVFDGLTTEKNVELFHLLCKKMQLPCFSAMFEKWSKKVSDNFEDFASLDTEEQAKVLVQLVKLLKTNRADTCDFKSIGLNAQSGKLTINADLSTAGFESICIIDKSPSGLIEKRSPNLLEL